jgi:hypothetical protein
MFLQLDISGEIKWHGALLGLVVKLNLYICITTDVGRWQLWGCHFYQESFLKLHKEFLFQGFCGGIYIHTHSKSLTYAAFVPKVSAQVEKPRKLYGA